VSPFIPITVHRRTLLRDALIGAAEAHDMPLTVKHLGLLAAAVTTAMYPDDGHPDPALVHGRRPDREPAGGNLTDDERTTFRLMADGLTVRETSQRTGWSENVIRYHRRRGYAKLGARDRTHAIWLLTNGGELPPEGPE
jgi:DNA-binding CsgD family transcriptional regulator